MDVLCISMILCMKKLFCMFYTVTILVFYGQKRKLGIEHMGFQEPF